MTIALADRRTVPEAALLPEQLTFKTAEAFAGEAIAVDEAEGIVTAIVSVTGVVDEVDDIIVPGAYAETLAKRRPKVCWAHSWEHPIGKVLYIEELMPGDPRLPKKTRDGKPWPKEAGALVASMKFNLRTDEGKNAFEVVRFYSETGECEYSIGYQVPPGKAAKDSRGTRFIKMLELYELSVVLFGAHTMTGTLSIKDAARAVVEVKRLGNAAVRGIDFRALAVKAPVPPQFQKDETDDTAAAPEGEEKPEKIKPNVTDEPGLVSDADTTLTADNCPCGDKVVYDTANGWQRLDGSYGHDDGTTHSDWLLPPDSVETENETDAPEAAAGDTVPDAGTDAEADAEKDAEGSAAAGAEAAAEGDTGTDAGEDGATDSAPDFSDGIMVAIYPDPAAADAVANHIAGPDDTTPREDLHVTLAYLGKIGEPDQMSEQAIIDAVIRAVEGKPALTGEVGGIGMFPAGEDGAPTYAPVDIPGLNLLREQIVSQLGDAVYNDHGFTPHMTLGYNIGLIQPLPAIPITVNAVRVVYGNSQRAITLGAALPDAKALPMLFTEVDPPEVGEHKQRWFRTSDASMHEYDGDAKEWKPMDPTAGISAKASAYDPTLDLSPIETVGAMAKRLAAIIEIEGPDAIEGKAGGADRNRGEAEQLRRYWTTGEGGAKIAWGTDGDFTRCVGFLSEHMTPERAKGYCANRHKEMTGMWPGDAGNKDAGAATETKGGLDVAVPAGKAYPQMPGSYEEVMQTVRLAIETQYEDEVDEHGNRTVWVDIRSTWIDRVLYSVCNYRSSSDDTRYYMAPYRLAEDGTVTLGEATEVELTIIPIAVDDTPVDDDTPVGDMLPLAEDIMSIVSAFKTASKQAMEAKAGRVLSGANERALRTAFSHLIAVLLAAGIDLGDINPEDPQPLGNTGGSSGDQRREIDPAVDIETTSPAAITKGADVEQETKGLGGEMETFDWEKHKALLAEIATVSEEI